jgi:hypothetical protein
MGVRSKEDIEGRYLDAAKKIALALRRVNEEIYQDLAGIRDAHERHVAGGLSREGYNGGYADALADVLGVFNQVQPNGRSARYWRE